VLQNRVEELTVHFDPIPIHFDIVEMEIPPILAGIAVLILIAAMAYWFVYRRRQSRTKN
jgi:hypothetical protein